MSRPFLLVLIAVAGFGLLAPRAARAWDPEADRVVAQLALTRLTPAAHAGVDALLAGGVSVDGCTATSLDQAARMADCLHRSRANFIGEVDYDATPLCGPPKPACRDGRCASQVLARDLAVVANPSAPKDARALALLAVAYLTAEIHEPLHAADNGDDSGERVRVVLPGAAKAKTNLYSVWDNDLVFDALGGDASTGLPYVGAVAAAKGADWTGGTIADWIAGSHDVALHAVYGALPSPPACGKRPDQPEALGPAYFQTGVAAVREQLAKAGVRLAVLLNRAFADAGAAPGAPAGG